MTLGRCKYHALVALAAGLCLSACRPADYRTRYVPQESVARAALAAALTAWQSNNDQRHLRLDNETAVEVIDVSRRPGQTLRQFNILGDISTDGGRWFEVELMLDNPAQVERVRYCVIGIDPLWVFRQWDYEQLAHWDHPMPADPQIDSEGE
jgi:hypothetical protein